MESDNIIYDNSIYTIEKHSGKNNVKIMLKLNYWYILGSVFCIDVTKNYLASGGEDDKAYIWEYNGENQIFNLYYESEKAKDSIISVKFSNDGKYLALSDMGGFISVIEI